jgi:DNA-binding LytR/AlgR family response regulator
MKVIIIEDETPAANRLERMLKDLNPGIEILKRMDSVEDAVECFKLNPEVDLIFMDIQLADGLSFDIFKSVNVPAPVIFTTAYDHYAIKAFKVNSIDYLLKPISDEDLKGALEKYELVKGNGKGNNDDLRAIVESVRSEQAHFRKRFLVKTAGRLAFVPASEVAYFFSEEGVTFIVNAQNERYLLENTLEELESQLDPTEFFRINRKMILSTGCIARIEPHTNNRLLLNVSPDFSEEVVVSRHRTSEFKSWLDS